MQVVTLEDGERWWGGAVADGTVMPFRAGHRRDLGWSAGKPDDPAHGPNQSAPLLLSSTGRYLWSDHPFAFTFGDGTLEISGRGITLDRAGASLGDAFRAASRRFFPPSGRAPARELFTGPQYNTWIEMPYEPTQKTVLGYARRILDDGLPPGVLMIDDCWSPGYGTWRFDPARFPDPRGMIDQLHDQGFSVMLWLAPFVSPDSATFRELARRGLLVGDPAIVQWWNGWSAVLDATNPEAVAWLHGELDALIAEHGVDGFKFDAGDLHFYPADGPSQSEAWARAGERYPFNEYRACWKMGGRPLAQRLHDKPSAWTGDGLASLIPELIAQGLIGHPFSCPDMIGGGELGAVGFDDPEFFVRYAQVAALSPMMQFSTLPDRVLDERHRAAVRTALDIRRDLLPTILELVDRAAVTGEPIIRPMAYHDAEEAPGQFFLGPDVLVAPVLEPGATERTVAIPAGTWRADDGATVTGPATITVPVTLDRIPLFLSAR
ncbi:glycoside hydrolase family 31 protein [Actinoplanes sp. NBRC 103695]|uniref:glycoside hydrolase family 31 protein n=1 Tax=Actinoplanes sp. NBRC 103695 TaxID=3032202 RepID=UPI0024A42BA7|nr:glycoside hydrolase family 31 protein [Actinoplanes sp. NBRC 103695]GLY98630.1 glycosyl hydrolase family 31 [Actinoplanes sp. NBRC 103695]